MNNVIHKNANNGVYRAGFATTQAAYENAFDLLFNTLEELESTLSRQYYLVGDYLPRWCVLMLCITITLKPIKTLAGLFKSMVIHMFEKIFLNTLLIIFYKR